MSVRERLANCFALVFPELDRDQIYAATTQDVAAWDSIAAITLVTVIDEEFAIAVPFEQLAELTSFELILEYLTGRDAQLAGSRGDQ